MSADSVAVPVIAAPPAVDAWRRYRSYDRVTRGRIHPAFWWGGGLLLASQVARLAVSGTATWLAFAAWFTR